MDYDIVTTTRDAALLAKDLRKVRRLPWDTETDCTNDSFDYMNERQVMWQYATEKKAWLIDVRTADPQVFKPIMEDPTIEKLVHNAAFDCSWTKREHNITTRGIRDTRLQENLMLGMNFPRKPPKGMKKVVFDSFKPALSASLEFCLSRRGLPDKLPFMPFYWNTPWNDEQCFYSVRDVEFLLTLCDDQERFLIDNNMYNLMRLENRTAEITYHMMVRGFGVDSLRWRKLSRQYEDKYNRAMRTLSRLAPGVSWTSPKQYCAYFGVQKTDDLEHMALDGIKGEVLQAFKDARDWRKMVNTYGEVWLDKYLEDDSTVHCSYTQIVNTGRYSCDDPNLQQIPVRTGVTRTAVHFKECFYPSHYDNGRFVIADFKGQELAIMAYGSQEPFWLEVLRAGGDLHAAIAEKYLFRDVWARSTDKERKEYRRLIKEVNFGIAYGLSNSGYAAKANVSIERANQILAAYRRAFPKLIAWLESNADFTKATGLSYSFPPFNRLRTTHLDPEQWRKKNIGMNNPVQGTAADMMKLAMCHVDKELTEEYGIIIHCLHDELIIECPLEYVDYVKEVIDYAMRKACITILGEALTYPEIEVQEHILKAA